MALYSVAECGCGSTGGGIMSKDMLWLHAMTYMFLSHMLLHDVRQPGPWSAFVGVAGFFALLTSGMYIVRWLWPETKEEAE